MIPERITIFDYIEDISDNLLKTGKKKKKSIIRSLTQQLKKGNTVYHKSVNYIGKEPGLEKTKRFLVDDPIPRKEDCAGHFSKKMVQ